MRMFLPSLPLSGSFIAGSTAAPRGPGLEMAAGRQGDPCPKELWGLRGKERCCPGPSEHPQNSGAPGVSAICLVSRGIWRWNQNGSNIRASQDCSSLPYSDPPALWDLTDPPELISGRGSLLISHLPSRQGRGKVSQFGLRDIHPYLVKPEAPTGNTFTASLPVPPPNTLSLHCIPSSSACSALPCVFASALRQSQDLKGQVSIEKNCEQLTCVEEITVLSLNNTLKLVWQSAESSDPDLVKEGRIWTLTWFIVRRSSPHCSLELSWLLLSAVFPETFFWKIKQFFMPDILLSWNYFCVQIKSLLCLDFSTYISSETNLSSAAFCQCHGSELTLVFKHSWENMDARNSAAI